MSRLDELVERALVGGLPARVDLERLGVPQPAAFWRSGERGAVLLLVRRRDRSVHALVAVASRTPDGHWGIEADGGFAWVDDPLPGDFRQLGEFGALGLQVLPGIAPSWAARVHGRRGEDTASCEVGRALRAFVLAFPAGAGPSTLELTAFDERGNEVARCARHVGELDYP